MASAVGQIPELVTHIVANLSRSKRGLLSCSRVLSTWYFCVRPYLFTTVCLQGTVWDRKPLYMRITAFLAFIQSTNSIGEYLQELCFRDDQSNDPYVNSTVLASLSPHLPRLHSIRLLDIAFRGAKVPRPQLEPRRKIHSLEFRFIRSNSHTVQDVLDILGLFSHVDELQLSFNDRQGIHSMHRGSLTASAPSIPSLSTWDIVLTDHLVQIGILHHAFKLCDRVTVT